MAIGIRFREAVRADLETIVAMLADDPIGADREDPSLPLARAYLDAFAAIAADPHNDVVVAEIDGQIAGFLQLTITPSLTRLGRSRATIEGVRVHRTRRGQGIGRALIDEAIRRARAAKCLLVQLTSDKERPEALRFYGAIGFRATHEGFKLHLADR